MVAIIVKIKGKIKLVVLKLFCGVYLNRRVFVMKKIIKLKRLRSYDATLRREIASKKNDH